MPHTSSNTHFSPSLLPLSPSHVSLSIPGSCRGLRTTMAVRYHAPSSLLSLDRLNPCRVLPLEAEAAAEMAAPCQNLKARSLECKFVTKLMNGINHRLTSLYNLAKNGYAECLHRRILRRLGRHGPCACAPTSQTAHLELPPLQCILAIATL